MLRRGAVADRHICAHIFLLLLLIIFAKCLLLYTTIETECCKESVQSCKLDHLDYNMQKDTRSEYNMHVQDVASEG